MYKTLCFLCVSYIFSVSGNNTSFEKNGITFKKIEDGTYSLSTHEIVVLKHASIADVEDMKTLYLMDEDFTDMEPGTFQNLPSLTNLLIVFNNIPTVRTGIFNSLTNLTKLDLSANRVSHIESHAFDNMTKLRELVLSNNLLKSIDIHWFKLTPSLELIDLHSNRLSEIPGNIFSNLKSSGPHYLLFEENSITRIDKDAFKGLKIISLLSLDSNYLETLNGDFLHDLEIDRVFIKDNKIKCVDQENFVKVFVANTTALSGNPWKTECKTEIETWAKQHNKDVVLA